MPLLSRIANIFRSGRLASEIDEELQSHVAEAVEQGRDRGEAQRAFGSSLRHREESHDIRILPWLDSLRADAVFGARQLLKKKAASAVAILSLAIAIGSCGGAFRLIDALLLRPLPVAHADRLYHVYRQAVDSDGKAGSYDVWAYPSFQTMRAAVKGQAELIAVSLGERLDVTYNSDQEVEKAFVQYVSGWMFDALGLRPSLGRLLTENDDRKPGAQPVAVISYDYWKRRFADDANVIGRSFRLNDRVYEIVGIGPEPFTGTETGAVTDIFLPTMMHAGATKDDWTWHRTLALLNLGVVIEPVRAKLNATSYAWEENRAKGFVGMTKESIRRFLDQTVVLESAAAGASGLQQDYHRSLIALAVLVALVLLIACANVANLMTVQAAGRAREMALRVSIGAGRSRLIQLVLVESAMLACLAAAAGAGFAWWSAPFIVARINPPDNPVRLSLPADWRVLGFGLALTFAVTLLFGLAPALRASAVKPASILKGGGDPHSRRRFMHGLVAAQVAFCFLVVFVAGLFAATFQRLSHRDIGFSPERILTLDTIAQRATPPIVWDQIADRLRAVPGVEKVSLSEWPLLNTRGWNGFVSVNGAPPGPVLAYFLKISPGFIDVMKMHLLVGRDLREGETSPGSAIVNQTFVRQFFGGTIPIGQMFAKGSDKYQVVGIVRDAPYDNLRESPRPVAYVPFHLINAAGAPIPMREGNFEVRTASENPLALVSALRREIPNARPDFHVSNIRTEQELIDRQTIRERLLAMLALFFAALALLLAGIGLYGVLDYSVLQQRREIGIRVAIGAQATDIAGRVVSEVFAMMLTGVVAGIALGVVSIRYLESLLYQVNSASAAMLALPGLIIVASALLATLPAVIRALRIDPASMLRAD
jgi:predicted permease